MPDRASADESHRSRFGLGALEDAGRDVEGSDGLIVLYAERDDPRGLAALPARVSVPCGCTPCGTGLSVVPLTQVVEVDETRAALRHEVFGGLAVPLLLSGWAGRRSAAASSCQPLDARSRSVLLP